MINKKIQKYGWKSEIYKQREYNNYNMFPVIFRGRWMLFFEGRVLEIEF